MIAVGRLLTILPWLIRAATSGRQLPPKGNRILMLSISQIERDPRITKVARSLGQAGFEIDVMAPAAGDAVAEYATDPGVRHVRVPRTWNWRLFLVYQDEFRRAGLTRQFDYVHANDLTTLTVAWILARVRRVPLVYDAHELWTENVQPKGTEWVAMSRSTRFVARIWEQLLLRHVDLVATVSPSIADEFQRRDRSNGAPLLLPNYPSLTLRTTPGTPTIRAACGLDDSNFVTLYLGGVNPLRNIEGVVRAHALLPESHVL